MNKSKKRVFYRTLNNLFGNPATMDMDVRKNIITLFAGWVKQNSPTAKKKMDKYALYYLTERESFVPVVPVDLYNKHAILSLEKFRKPSWYWKLAPLVRCPDKFPDFRIDRTIYAPNPRLTWDWMDKGYNKHLSIMIPANYHNTVAKHGVHLDNKKLVQRIWNRREYTDMETWECSFWDFSHVTKSESSWTKAMWYEGFVVKTAINHAVDVSLQRAINLATRRTVTAGIKSILSDQD